MFASGIVRCHDVPMNNHRREARAGGAILALSIVTGMIIGIAMRQPSIGVLAGISVGVVSLVVVWLIDQR